MAKLNFIIFATFKVSSDLEPRSQVIQGHTFWQRKPAYDFIWAVNSNFCSIFNRFGDVDAAKPHSRKFMQRHSNISVVTFTPMRLDDQSNLIVTRQLWRFVHI